jgi:flagellar secretion chaperone FliS
MTNPRTAYRETDVRGATAVRLVVLLYEQAIQDLRQATQAMDENNIELRTNRINHALEVISRLQATLNLEHGGQVARNLLGFYEALRANLWKAQLYMSKETLLQQITDLLTLREAWAEVDRAESAGSTPKPASLAAAASNNSSAQRVPANWKA